MFVANFTYIGLGIKLPFYDEYTLLMSLFSIGIAIHYGVSSSIKNLFICFQFPLPFLIESLIPDSGYMQYFIFKNGHFFIIGLFLTWFIISSVGVLSIILEERNKKRVEFRGSDVKIPVLVIFTMAINCLEFNYLMWFIIPGLFLIGIYLDVD
jgi:hypothetical protein